MDELDLKELKKYKDTQDFRKKYGSKDEESTLGEILSDIVSEGLDYINHKSDLELIGTPFDPYGIWYEGDKEKAAKYDRLKELDEKRPELKELKYDPIPKDKVAGLRVKFGLFSGLWNKFVDEVEAGRAGVCEVLVADYRPFRENGKDVFYFKVADLDGLVYTGGVRKIHYPELNNYVEEQKRGWMDPEDYMNTYKKASDEECRLYEAVYRANAYAERICTENKWHCYVIHFNAKGKDYYGLMTKLEYEDFKRVKDDFSFLTPENCFSPMSNFHISFDW